MDLGVSAQLKRSFKPCQEDFHEWKEKLMKSREIIWRKGGVNEG